MATKTTMESMTKKKEFDRAQTIKRVTDFLSENRYSKREIAEILGISRQRLYEIIGTIKKAEKTPTKK